MVKGTEISPYDVVHDAILLNPDAGIKDLKDAFYSEVRRRKKLVELSATTIIRSREIEYVCIRCGEPLPAGAFYQRKDGRLRTDCKACQAARLRQWRAKHPTTPCASRSSRSKLPAEHFKAKDREYSRRYREKNHEAILAKQRAARAKNKKQIRKAAKEYRKNNRERISKQRKKKYREDKLKKAKGLLVDPGNRKDSQNSRK